jgi:hypothetical protein
LNGSASASAAGGPHTLWRALAPSQHAAPRPIHARWANGSASSLVGERPLLAARDGECFYNPSTGVPRDPVIPGSNDRWLSGQPLLAWREAFLARSPFAPSPAEGVIFLARNGRRIGRKLAGNGQ